MASWPVNSKILLGGLLMSLTLFLLLRAGSLREGLNKNLGFVYLNRATDAQDEAEIQKYAAAAQPYFITATSLPPKNYPSGRGLGLSYGIQEDFSEAESIFASLGKPTAGDYALLGDLAQRIGQPALAIRWYEQSVDLDPDQYPIWLKLSLLLENNGEAKKALKVVEMVWLRAPEWGFAPYVSALLARSDFSAAEEVLQEVLFSGSENSERLWGWRTLGQLLQDQERWVEAQEVFSAGLKEFNQDPSLLVSLGWLLYENDPQSARKLFEEAVSANEEDGIGYFAMGQLLAQENDFAAADEWFQLALERNDTTPRWMVIRGNTARRAGHLTQAVDIYKDATARFPGYLATYFELAETYQQLDAPDQAVETLNQVMAFAAKPPARYLLSAAEIYKWAGHPERAVEIYEALLKSDPGNSAAIAGLKGLQDN